MTSLDKAKLVLSQATTLDRENKPNDAWVKYLEGIELLWEYQKTLQPGETKSTIQSRVDSYMTRAEELRKKVKVETRFLEQRKIAGDSTGHGYDKVFSRCLDEKLTAVTVQDAYIKAHHQILNFVRFCELVVAKAKNLRIICLCTAKDCESNKEAFSELESSLKKRDIILRVSYVPNLHDREIRFNNGWVVKIGRGLDYFKNPGRYAIGTCDMNLRTCHETIIDMYKEVS